MSGKEHQELNQWIAENVFGWRYVDRPKNCIQQHHWKGIKWPILIPSGHPLQECQVPEYTTDPAAAMEALKKCYATEYGIVSGFSKGKYWFAFHGASRTLAESETLELAIALFARKLFSCNSGVHK